jgi:hypothetical protein
MDINARRRFARRIIARMEVKFGLNFILRKKFIKNFCWKSWANLNNFIPYYS